jgi:hypothetical protein
MVDVTPLQASAALFLYTPTFQPGDEPDPGGVDELDAGTEPHGDPGLWWPGRLKAQISFGFSVGALSGRLKMSHLLAIMEP